MIDAHELAVKWHFEPDGDGFIYYGGPHSRGIRVTKAERDVFIRGDKDEWHRIIDHREPTEPVRPFWPAFRERMRDLPSECAVLALGIGLVCSKRAYEAYLSLPFDGERAPLVLAAWTLGALLLVLLGALGLWARIQRKRNDR
jgi:hypothetical protein